MRGGDRNNHLSDSVKVMQKSISPYLPMPAFLLCLAFPLVHALHSCYLRVGATRLLTEQRAWWLKISRIQIGRSPMNFNNLRKSIIEFTNFSSGKFRFLFELRNKSDGLKYLHVFPHLIPNFHILFWSVQDSDVCLGQ